MKSNHCALVMADRIRLFPSFMGWGCILYRLTKHGFIMLMISPTGKTLTAKYSPTELGVEPPKYAFIRRFSSKDWQMKLRAFISKVQKAELAGPNGGRSKS